MTHFANRWFPIGGWLITGFTPGYSRPVPVNRPGTPNRHNAAGSQRHRRGATTHHFLFPVPPPYVIITAAKVIDIV